MYRLSQYGAMKILTAVCTFAYMLGLALLTPVRSQLFELEESTYKAKEALDEIFASKGLRKPRIMIVNSVLGTNLTRCSSGGGHGYTQVTKESGPFYCPLEHVYYMPARFLEVFLYNYGPGSISFVTAHEIAHAYQNEMGLRKKPPYHEWQADCIAGAAMRSSSFTSRERSEAAKAALAVGGGATHGSGIGRQQSFLKGLALGLRGCI